MYNVNKSKIICFCNVKLFIRSVLPHKYESWILHIEAMDHSKTSTYGFEEE